MEYAQVTVRLAGSLLNTVTKEVSAPEIVILKSLHGSDSIVDIKKSKTDATPGSSDRPRLELVYGEDKVEKVFPGALNKLPATLAEVGVEEPVEASKKAK